MTMSHAQIAAVVYQACTTYDQYLPALSSDVARSWSKVFAYYALGPDDLLAGVDKLYAEQGSGYRPLPADIAKAARAIRQERTERESDSERGIREAEIDARIAAHVAEIAEAKAVPDAVPSKFQRPQHNALLVICPTCRASIGRHCTSSGAKLLRRRPYHPTRIEAATIRGRAS